MVRDTDGDEASRANLSIYLKSQPDFTDCPSLWMLWMC